MNRREALRVLGASAGIEMLAAITPDALFALGEETHHAIRSQASRAQTRQLEIIVAAAERIIPASDTPGATDANVGAFIERILSDWYSSAERDRLVSGLDGLDSRSHAMHARAFSQCTTEQQDALLIAFDDEVTALRDARARSPGGDNPDAHWFSMFKYLTVWGYFTSEAAARETLHEFPQPGHFDGCASYEPASRGN